MEKSLENKIKNEAPDKSNLSYEMQKRSNAFAEKGLRELYAIMDRICSNSFIPKDYNKK